MHTYQRDLYEILGVNVSVKQLDPHALRLGA